MLPNIRKNNNKDIKDYEGGDDDQQPSSKKKDKTDTYEKAKSLPAPSKNTIQINQ